MKRNYEYLLSDLSLLKGVGTKTSNLLKKKKVNTIFDLLWKLPKSFTDRSLSSKIKDLKSSNLDTHFTTISYSGLNTKKEDDENKDDENKDDEKEDDEKEEDEKETIS